MKNEVRQRKPIPFSWRLGKKWCKNECFLKWDTECLRERNGEDSEQSQKFEGKTEKVLKTVFEMQNVRFLRLIQVARTPAKTLQAKSFKKICQVFFVTGSLICEGVASWAAKISVYPLRLDLSLANKLPKQTCELATWMTCDWVAKTRQHCFLKFSVFVKTKYFPKTPKTLKNLFVFESTKIENVKTHFIKYNHTNEYGIHWT